MRWLYFLLTLSVPACSLQSGLIPPGIRNALMGDVVTHSDFTLNLFPPEESSQETRREIDALAQAEWMLAEIKIQHAADADMAETQHKMLRALPSPGFTLQLIKSQVGQVKAMLEINIFLSQTNQMKAAFLPTGCPREKAMVTYMHPGRNTICSGAAIGIDLTQAPNWLQSGNLLLLWDAAAVFWKEHSELAAVGKELRDC
ncbi:hypothetical protein AK812_SmicGene21367 [Symbiodinium microadriaticum]|uniref:Uncharacterized protein n=1 Tax=Symbiodinium microadriaticum TaxID=2951 RepID=A0A1Q9DMJ2_SYMMI|nr:hypothetical protein AK812_SmicGene21367 [Symbiodinium microadriaticum]